MAIQEKSAKPVVLVTGSSGLIGSQLTQRLRDEYQVVGLDVQPPPELTPEVEWIQCDMTERDSVEAALALVRDQYGSHIASVVHLAAYYDFSGKPSVLYKELTVEGTRRLLQSLRVFQVEQFIFSSTLLVQNPSQPGEPLTESSPLDAEWEYPESKLGAELVIRDEAEGIPALILRIAGVYDENCHSLPIAHQIKRIYEKEITSYVFPGNKTHGQSFIHMEDVMECFRAAIRRRGRLDPYEVLLIGEEDVMSYEELQDTLGELIHGKEWPTIRIPKPVAKAGAWVQEKFAAEEHAPFIKVWMVDLADQHYPVDLRRARERLQWLPPHTLRATLPTMIERLKQDPRGWYERNKLPLPAALEQAGEVPAETRH